eukprot:COSAG01_NODE_22399_length_857_cov_1.423483_1_plen_229_part_10
MEPEPEDEEQAEAAAEAPDGTAVAARVDVAGHEVSANSTALDVSEWKLTAAQVREVAGALSQLLCLRELVLDGVPVSGSTPWNGDFRYGAETLDADLEMFRALCEGLRARQGLASLSLKKCYLGPQALALLVELFRDAGAVINSLNLSANPLTGASKKYIGTHMFDSDFDSDITGFTLLCDALPTAKTLTSLILCDCGVSVKGVTSLAKAMSAGAALAHLVICQNKIGS